ncbi:heme-binding domain-containing protein [Cellulophaga baltica]|uniref:heme-binding domain-containing protein n=1 Tax=Cellulophaga TaxID=104264 RepID=UPI001C069082|nr:MULTISPECIES: heme-binding domain-containing protein [Cellulophaga]MBU2995222.1 heme-binding domain-containing protein [Cellulophaga baltica]MDO6766617.1 heme-binding domain-containing protein [Cellulophaga sp. 1_MG-2023]
MLKKILLLLVVIFIILQFFRPEKNNSNDITYDISTKYEIPEEVNNLLKVSCNDCHSNKTEYPWYANIQPVGWWLNDHIEDGKRHLNFSEFTKKSIAVQNHKLEETIEMVEKKYMPIDDYTKFGLHEEANLTDEERNEIINWAETQMNYLKQTYPADSLILKRKRN